MAGDTEINFDRYLKATLVKVLDHVCKRSLYLDESDVRYHLHRFERQIRQEKQQQKLDRLDSQIEQAREEGNKGRELELMEKWADLICKDLNMPGS